MIIGLTGGSGTGKSTASAFFRDSGFAVADLDAIARTVCAPGTACLAEIDAAFGGVVDSDGVLNRHKLGDIVFNDGEKLKLLNSITHKYIIEETKKFILKNSGRNIVLDAPLLFESGLGALCDVTVGILSSTQNRIKRIVKRDGITASQAQSRINSQPGDDFYTSKCTLILRNDLTPADLMRSLSAHFGGLEYGKE